MKLCIASISLSARSTNASIADDEIPCRSGLLRGRRCAAADEPMTVAASNSRRARAAWSMGSLRSGDREIITSRAHLHDHIVAALASRMNTVAGFERYSPFADVAKATVPQGDFGGRIRRNDDIEREPLPIACPEGRERAVRRFEGRSRARQACPRSWRDACP